MMEPGATVPSGVGLAAFCTPAGAMKGTESSMATIVCGADISSVPVEYVPDRSPPQRLNLNPFLGTAVTLTCVPSAKKPSGDAVSNLNVTAFPGSDPVAS